MGPYRSMLNAAGITAIKASLALMPLNQITPLVGIPLSQIWGPLVLLILGNRTQYLQWP